MEYIFMIKSGIQSGFYEEKGAQLINKAQTISHYYLEELQDPKTKGLPLLGSPVPLLLISVVWLYIVLRAGPRYMSNRKPYHLKSVIQAYNIFQVVINTYIVYECFAGAWFKGYTLPCTPHDKSTSPGAMRVARMTYITYLLKVVDLLETFFFVLRRKNNQISVLHVYHHVGLPFIMYVILKYSPGGQAVFPITVNSTIHAIMYTYYMLAAMGPKLQPYLWWKKYLTRLQLIQFVVLITHMTYTVIDEECEFSLLGSGLFIPYNIGLIILFSNFYIQNYRIQKQRVENSANKKNDGDVTLKSSLAPVQLPAVLNPCHQFNMHND